MNDPVNHPSHYGGFSNGAEAIDITEHLNSNGGQAAGYLIRATRIDPERNKHQHIDGLIEDVEKAVWFATREAQRLKRLKHQQRGMTAIEGDKTEDAPHITLVADAIFEYLWDRGGFINREQCRNVALHLDELGLIKEMSWA